jgi:hypothetical protein
VNLIHYVVKMVIFQMSIKFHAIKVPQKWLIKPLFLWNFHVIMMIHFLIDGDSNYSP